MRTVLPILTALAAALVLLAAGCGSQKVTTPTAPAPQLNPAGFVRLDEDTSVARDLRVVYLRFSWETDQTSADVLVYGPRPDSLRDSLVAENLELPQTGGSVVHLHVAPPTAAPNGLQMQTAREFFYRIRMRSSNTTAPLGYSDVLRYRTFDPDLNRPQRTGL
ncbi:MAG TPA: hypothetical protein VMS93_10410 [Candidatus Saccharimonadales bacterium]|nr:hypothetical protein [Candidatus Saccharimonadales bacterium]